MVAYCLIGIALLNISGVEIYRRFSFIFIFKMEKNSINSNNPIMPCDFTTNRG
jgi:hypothetical protein